MVRVGSFTGIDAFPQKDDPARRVFREAKLSTAVFTLVKGRARTAGRSSAPASIPALVEEASPHLSLTTDSIPLYDPINFTIVSCDQADWDLAVQIMESGRMGRLRDVAEFFQGEVNETNERARRATSDRKWGEARHARRQICLYVVLRPASQGEDSSNVSVRLPPRQGTVHQGVPLTGTERIGLPESSPQNNFRRIIAAFIPAEDFCNHKVNYLPNPRLSIHFVLGLLNSKLCDWYFRLGSTNAAVSHYQLYNLPCPYLPPSPPSMKPISRRRRKAL